MLDRHVDWSSSIRLIGQRLFLDALSQFEGTIDLVWDGKNLMRQLNSIVTPKLLAEQTNVKKNYSLETAGSSGADNVVYLLCPTQRSIELLIKNWLQTTDEATNSSNHVLFVPEESYTLRERLKEDQKVWSRISTVRSLPLCWFPTEQRALITMDLPQLPSQMLVNGDWNFLFKCAKSLDSLIPHLNGVPKIYCKGEWSARIADILRKLPEKLEPGASGTSERSDFRGIASIVIIDRWIDPLTPMLRQNTFAGACDEFFGIDSRGAIKVPLNELEEGEPMESSASGNEAKEIHLNDQVFEQLQDCSMNSVAFKLRVLVDELKEEEQQRRSLASLAEYKNFVAKLPNVVVKRKSTGLFMRLAGIIQRREADDFHREMLRCEQEILKNPQPERMHPFIETSLAEARGKNDLMRLIILQALTSRGLKQSVWQTYSKLIIQSYGISELKWLLKLQLAGLVRDEHFADGRQEMRYPMINFGQQIKKYKLPLAEENRLSDPIGKYSLLVRTIEEGLQTNWSEFTSISMENIANKEDKHANTADPSNFDPDLPQTLVFVVGGITRDEMSMLKSLPQKMACCTTALLNGNKLLNSFHD